ncbi:MAG: hypothetical protein WBE76_04960 [Terracidiphilus sp.]
MQFRVEHEIKSLDTYYIEADTAEEVLQMWKDGLFPDKNGGRAEKTPSPCSQRFVHLVPGPINIFMPANWARYGFKRNRVKDNLFFPAIVHVCKVNVFITPLAFHTKGFCHGSFI